MNQAAASAGITGPPAFEAACLGLSGGPDDKEALARETIRAERYLITHDAHIALAGATGGEPGIIVIAGTGSMVFGRNAAGVTARAGGWGYMFGDEGGAFDLVRQALRAILRNEEGWGPPTALREALLEATGARDGNQLLHRLYTDEYPRDRVAGWAKLIDQAARAGDAVAGDILGSAAQALATHDRGGAPAALWSRPRQWTFAIAAECSAAIHCSKDFGCWWNWRKEIGYRLRGIMRRRERCWRRIA